MKASVKWQENMVFNGYNEVNPSVVRMDAVSAEIGGANSGTTPKHMFLQSIAGCTGIDVILILKRMRSPMPDDFFMDIDGQAGDEEPHVFTLITLTYNFTGDLKEKNLIRAAQLSQDRYCSVSIMVKGICDFEYVINLNGSEIYREKNSLK